MGEVAAVMYDGIRRARPPGQGSLIMPDPPLSACSLNRSHARGKGGNTADTEPPGRNGELANNLGAMMGTK